MSFRNTEALLSLQELSTIAQEGKQILQKWIRNPCNFMELESETEIREALRDGSDTRQYTALMSLIKGVILYDRYYRVYPEVVKILGTQNVEVKRLCFLLIGLISSRCDALAESCSYDQFGTMAGPHELKTFIAHTTLLSVNALQKDCYNRHHVIRGWALRTLSQLCISDKTPLLIDVISKGVGDSSPFVRQMTAYVALRLALSEPSTVGFVLKCILLRLLNDIEDIVVAAALHNFYYIVSFFPDLLSLDHTTLEKNVTRYGLDCPLSCSRDRNVHEDVPLLSCLHPLFCQLVTHSLDRLPFYGQVAGIYLLTCYCRTFFPSPNHSDVDSSGHYQLFLSRLIYFKHSASSCVFMASCQGLLLLVPESCLVETIDEILPSLIHRLRISTPCSTLTLLNAAVWIIQRCASPSLLSLLPFTNITYYDSPLVVLSKLALVAALAILPDYPVDSVCYDLLEASFRQDIETHRICHFNIFQTIKKIIKLRVEHHLDIPLENILERFLSCLASVATPLRQERILEILSQLTQASSTLSTARLKSLLILVAHHVERFLQNRAEEALAGGLSAAVQLFIDHHEAVPDIALDVFHTLVKAMMNEKSLFFLEDQELQMRILFYGASLCAFYNVSKDGDSKQEEREVDPRLSNLPQLFIALVRYLAHSPLVVSNVRDIAKLCHSYAKVLPSSFFSFFKPTSSSSRAVLLCSFDLTLDPTTQHFLNNVLRVESLVNIPDFVPCSPQSGSSRKVVLDSQRASARFNPLCLSTTNAVQQHSHATPTFQEKPCSSDDEIEKFYGSEQWRTPHNTDTSHSLLDIAVRTFVGSKGSVIEGEEVETQSDEERSSVEDRGTERFDNSQEQHVVLHNHMDSVNPGKETESDADDWYYIKNTELLCVNQTKKFDMVKKV